MRLLADYDDFRRKGARDIGHAEALAEQVPESLSKLKDLATREPVLTRSAGKRIEEGPQRGCEDGGRATCLCAAGPVAAAELVHGTPELVLNRLALLENVSPAYERYLRTFCAHMTTAAPWAGLPSLPLPADANVASNIVSVTDWVKRVLEPE